MICYKEISYLIKLLHFSCNQANRKDKQTDRAKTAYPPPVERGYNQNIGVQLSLFQNKFMVKKLPLNIVFLYYNILLPMFENACRMGGQVTVTTLPPNSEPLSIEEVVPPKNQLATVFQYH